MDSSSSTIPRDYNCPECSKTLSILNLRRHYASLHNIAPPASLLDQWKAFERQRKAIPKRKENLATVSSPTSTLHVTPPDNSTLLCTTRSGDPSPRVSKISARQRRFVITLPEIPVTCPLHACISGYFAVSFPKPRTLQKNLIHMRRLVHFLANREDNHAFDLSFLTETDFLRIMRQSSVSDVSTEIRSGPHWGKASLQIQCFHVFKLLLSFASDILFRNPGNLPEAELQTLLRYFDHQRSQFEQGVRPFNEAVKAAEETAKEDSCDPTALASVSSTITHIEQAKVVKIAYLRFNELVRASYEREITSEERVLALNALIVICFFYPQQVSRPMIFVEMTLDKLTTFLESTVRITH